MLAHQAFTHLRSVPFIVGTCDDQVKVIALAGDLRKGLDEELQSLFDTEPAKKEYESLATRLRPLGAELSGWRGDAVLRQIDSQRHDRASNVQAERAHLLHFFGRCEVHRRRALQISPFE